MHWTGSDRTGICLKVLKAGRERRQRRRFFFFFSNIFFHSSNQIGYHAIIFKQDKSLARSVDEKDTRFEKVREGGNRILNG